MKMNKLLKFGCTAGLVLTAVVTQADDKIRIGGFLFNHTNNTTLHLTELKCQNIQKAGSLIKLAPDSFDNKFPALFYFEAQKSKNSDLNPICRIAYSGDGYGCEFIAEYQGSNSWNVTPEPNNSDSYCRSVMRTDQKFWFIIAENTKK
jgi:hypothetical protein